MGEGGGAGKVRVGFWEVGFGVFVVFGGMGVDVVGFGVGVVVAASVGFQVSGFVLVLVFFFELAFGWGWGFPFGVGAEGLGEIFY